MAFNTPLHLPVRALTTNSAQTCPWFSRPNLNVARSSFQGASIAKSIRSLRRIPRTQRMVPTAVFSGGGILGVGPSEIVVIVAVGWLLLGPEKLLALSKDAGKFLGQLRKTADEAKDTFKDALDLDAMAAEANAISAELTAATTGKTSSEALPADSEGLSQAVAPQSKKSESSVIDSAVESEQTSGVVVEQAPRKGVDAEAENGASTAFLDQLRRVSDPNQVAPSEVPDLSVDVEELEVERLEQEYMDAKRKLDERRARAQVDEKNDVNAGADGG